jgi:murein DD-endopeptidase MepM/ murein hydrolase activator NlpD
MSKVTRELKNWPAYLDGTYHAGTDFAVPLGSNVYSTYNGVVDTVRDLGSASYGKYVVIKSIINGKVRYIYYAHLNKPTVEEKQTVMAGDIIGESGTTGNSEGPHLHYEVRNENKHYGSLDNPTLNPYDYLP